MHLSKLLLAFSAAMIISVASPMKASPIPMLDLTTLTREADLIVVGKVISISEQSSTSIVENGQLIPVRRMTALLSISRAVKGVPTATTLRFSFLVPRVPIGYAGVTASQFGMFFLRKTPDEIYAVQNTYYPFVPAAAKKGTAEGTDLDKVVAEVAQVIIAPEGSPEDRKRAVSMLERVETQGALAALKNAAGSLTPPVQLYAVAALLRRGDTSVLNIAEDALLRPSSQISVDLQRRLAFALKDGVTDPQAIPSLVRLLKASDAQTRRSAAAALRHIGSEDAVAPLSVALQDSDREVRYQAVLGLATITKQVEWGPSIDAFEREERKYLAHWLEWAKAK